jgi:hypothetical protein
LERFKSTSFMSGPFFSSISFRGRLPQSGLKAGMMIISLSYPLGDDLAQTRSLLDAPRGSTSLTDG